MKYKKIEKDDHYIIKNVGGAELGFQSISIVESDGFAFKDVLGTGQLVPYADWRLSDEERAMDLASRLSIDEIAGLMLYSPHQSVPFISMGPFVGTYDGKQFCEDEVEDWALTDQQKEFISQENIRHVLLMTANETWSTAKWNNKLQSHCERLPFVIPVNISSDPRHGISESFAEFRISGGEISKWPNGIGLSATFLPSLCKRFGEVASKEYRALGITTSLSPQVDLASEPRWMRFEDTFGSHTKLAIDMAKAYCDGFQTTQGSSDGWGKDSVLTMAKHWPGGGTGEGGRDAHYAFGSYAVYPGNNADEHLKPFTEGVFKLDGLTKQVSSIMPYYSVSWEYDSKNRENVGNSYSEFIIKDLLRGEYQYDGVVCTDWGITADPICDSNLDCFGSRCYGVENLTEAERHYRIIMNGVDQFGGNSSKEPILQAYALGCEQVGEETMRKRMEESAVRILKNMFRLGLFENPYLDVKESINIVGNDEFVQEGYTAQQKSVVMIKNKNGCLPLKKQIKIYVPSRTINDKKGFLRFSEPKSSGSPVTTEVLEQYFEIVNTPEEADAAIVFMESPLTDGGYNGSDFETSGNGYIPISLQYRPYTATSARGNSIAGGDFREKSPNRSYRGKTCTAANESDLDNLIDTKKAMGDKPVIASITMHNPTVMAELEPFANAIVVNFGVLKQVILDIIVGVVEPSGLLPFRLPLSMDAIESHCEDLSFDIAPYFDAQNNVYDFGFGLNFSGIICDERTAKYKI